MKRSCPTAANEIISYVGKFNFNWMTNYIYEDDAAPVFPKGTVIHVSAWYDNTKANTTNPDPDQWVGYGDRTVDEMAHAWMNVVYLNDDEYKALVEERKARAAHGGSSGRGSDAPRRGEMVVSPPRVAAGGILVSAQQLPSEPRREFGTSVTGAFEGWFANPDGSRTLSRRLPESQLRPGDRHSDRAEQPDRARRSRHGTADALPSRPAPRHVHRDGAEGLHAASSG